MRSSGLMNSFVWSTTVSHFPHQRARRLGSLILESFEEGSVFVSRYSGKLGYIADTGYQTREEAVADCSAEFGDQLGVWTPIPEHADHAETYVLSLLANERH